MTGRAGDSPRTAGHPAISRWGGPALLIALGLALYGYTLPFPFVFDDHIYLVNNPLATDARSFRYPFEFDSFAKRATSLGLDQDLSTNFILRPFAYFTFYVNYAIGGMHPPGFRAVNIAIHVGNALLLLGLAGRLLRHAAPTPASESSARFVALSAALLFLVHPLQIESVTYVIQRFTSFGTFFYLATVLLFVASRTASGEKVARRCRRWSIASLFVGTFTKEFLFTAPIMMVLLDWIVLHAPLRAACRRIIPWALLMPVIPVLMALTSAAQTGATSFDAWLNVAGTGNAREGYALHYALTQPGVILTYLRLIFVPTGLNIDPTRLPVTSAGEWRFIGPVLLLLSIFAGAWFWYRRQQQQPLRTVGFCFVLWFFLGLSIDSTVVPLPDLMSEHRCYLSTLGVFGAVACFAEMLRLRLQPWPEWRLFVPAAVAIWVIALMVATIDRHEIWRTNIALWSDTARKSPTKTRVWANLGTAFGTAQMNSRAAEAYSQAIARDSRNTHAHYNLAKVELRLGRFQQALAVADAGTGIDPQAHALHQLRAVALFNLGQRDAALESLKQAISLRPDEAWSHLALAEFLVAGGEHARARIHCESARSLLGNHEENTAWLRRIESTIRPVADSP